MFGRKIHIFTLLGFKVGIDVTWFVLALLIIWSLARGVFPQYFPDFSEATYWWMGVFGAIGLFASIVFHEFCHSLVARKFGLPMKGITLFIFGGIAEMEKEPQSPKSEMLMALAGPASSLLLAALCYAVAVAFDAIGLWAPLPAVLKYLAVLNLILAIFNLVPAFPLDGGRVLRSIIWAIKKDLVAATKTASRFGSGFGLVLMFLGVLSFFYGNIIGGVWYFLIGLFIKGASHSSYEQVLIKDALSGEKIENFMREDPITVSPSITVEHLVTDYFYKHHYKMFPVTENGKLLGFVTTKQVKKVPRGMWPDTDIRDLIVPPSSENTISPHAPAQRALEIMNTSGNSRIMVVDHGGLVGIITLKDMLKFLSIKMDLSGQQLPPKLASHSTE